MDGICPRYVDVELTPRKHLRKTNVVPSGPFTDGNPFSPLLVGLPIFHSLNA